MERHYFQTERLYPGEEDFPIAFARVVYTVSSFPPPPFMKSVFRTIVSWRLNLHRHTHHKTSIAMP